MRRWHRTFRKLRSEGPWWSRRLGGEWRRMKRREHLKRKKSVIQFETYTPSKQQTLGQRLTMRLLLVLRRGDTRKLRKRRMLLTGLRRPVAGTIILPPTTRRFALLPSRIHTLFRRRSVHAPRTIARRDRRFGGGRVAALMHMSCGTDGAGGRNAGASTRYAGQRRERSPT